MQKARNYFKFFLIFLFLTISSCLSRYNDHGYMFKDVDIDMIDPGFSNKKQVLAIMGSPTVTLYGENSENWIYLAEKVRNLLFLIPKTTERRVFSVYFDNNGIVAKASELSLEDQRQYVFDQEEGLVSDHKKGLFDAIFGNIGQVTPQ